MKLRTKILISALTLFLAVGVLAGLAVSAATESTPSVSIKSFSLSLENAVYINFKVAGENISNVKNIKILAWDEAPEAYDVSCADYVLSSVGTESATGYEQFKFTKLSAKEMTKMVYACAYYSDGTNEVYSAPVKFSVAMYADMQRAVAGQDEKLLTLIDNMLLYGASAQIYFNHNTDFLATDEVSKISVANGLLDDGFKLGWYKVGTKVTITANEPEEGYKFSHWENSTGERVGDFETITLTVGTDDTYTAVYEEEVEYFLYTALSDGTYSIAANPEATLPSKLIIPNIYNDKAVTQISEKGFVNHTEIKSANIPEGVRIIKEYAFSGCSGLTSVNIPNSVEDIKSYAFYGCEKLTQITIPDSVTSMGGWVFENCSSLNSVALSNSIKSIR